MSVTELVIDRALWGRTALLNKDGTMCCLGFLSKACGVPNNEMVHPNGASMGYPRREWISEYKLNDWAASAICAASKAACINDSRFQTDDTKEAELIELFKENGIALSFTGSKK